jgi:hypothetical protein
LVDFADVGDQVTVEKEDTLTCFALFEDKNIAKAALHQHMLHGWRVLPLPLPKNKRKI